MIQTKNFSKVKTGIFALVTKTGFSTTKGALVRSILYPKNSNFKFYSDSIKFILVLFIFAIIGIAISVPRNIYIGMNTSDIVLRMLDVFTITVPPALPAAMTVGIIFAENRLKK